MPVDLSGFHRKIAGLERAAPTARLNTLRRMMGDAGAEILARAPEDTRRLVRGFAMAFNAAKCGPFGVPQVRASRNFDKKHRDLVRQLRRLAYFKRVMESEGRTGEKHYRRLLKDIDRAKAHLAAATNTSIFMINKGRGVEITTRAQVYGGTGTSGQHEGGAFVTIVNREPHTRTVESRNRFVALAMAKLRGSGVRKSRARYAKELSALAGIGRG